MAGGWKTRGELDEGILWGMPRESRGTRRTAQCACVELISSPSSLPLRRSSSLLYLLSTLSRSRVLAAPEESTESRGIWPRCLFALSTLFPSLVSLPCSAFLPVSVYLPVLLFLCIFLHLPSLSLSSFFFRSSDSWYLFFFNFFFW